MRTTTKRIWLVVALVLAAGLGACADEPIAVEQETYSAQMDGQGDCTYVHGLWVCK